MNRIFSLLVLGLLVLLAQNGFAQRTVVFLDRKTEKPIAGLAVRYPTATRFTDANGAVIVPNDLVKITVSNPDYFIRNIYRPLRDTILLFSIAKVKQPPATYGNYYNASIKRRKFNSVGMIYPDKKLFQRIDIHNLSDKNAYLMYRLDEGELLKYDKEAKISVEIRSADKKWLDTASLVVNLDDKAISSVLRDSEDGIFAPGNLIKTKVFPIDSVKNGNLYIPIDSIASIYNEIFVNIGMINFKPQFFDQLKPFRSRSEYVHRLGFVTNEHVCYLYLCEKRRKTEKLKEEVDVPYNILVRGNKRITRNYQ